MLLRGDMDALPVTEDLPLDFVSEHEGLMHACGHDLHVAGLVGAARILHELRDELEGDVVFMFQPGEEGPGGAKPMIDEGLLEAAGRRVDAAYALHVYSSEHPLGTWFGRPGPLMAAADEVKVRVVGEGGHGSQPFRAKDPIPVACEIVVALQTLVTRQFDVFDPVVITVGKFVGGTKDNIIPDDAVFEATLRSLSEQARAEMAAKIELLATRPGRGPRADASRSTTCPGYPVTVNDEAEYAFAKDTIVDLFGPDRYVHQRDPEMGAEDFAFVGSAGAERLREPQRLPGRRLRVGTRQPLAPRRLRRLGGARRRRPARRAGPAPPGATESRARARPRLSGASPRSSADRASLLMLGRRFESCRGHQPRLLATHGWSGTAARVSCGTAGQKWGQPESSTTAIGS